MANQQIFCSTPWYEVNVYWTGDLGICCQESRKLYSGSEYNIKNTTIREWFNSKPVREFRQQVLSDTPTDVCLNCQIDESVSNSSRRHRSNQKTVIFTKTAFHNSFEQSPSRQHFNDDGITDTMPIDLHVDLGNYCNLACKMCDSQASTRIATQYVQWGYEAHRQYLGNDWTKDQTVWTRFLNELLTIPKLKNIHFMGGETLLTKRFEDFVDFMIAHEKFDLSFSFVTNGTTFNESLINKLKKFDRVGIEVSIETTTEHNNYIRQGTDTSQVLYNIRRYIDACDRSNISVTIRPAISALSVGYYYTLLEYCLENKLLIKSLLVNRPNHLAINVLPKEIKEQYKAPYKELLAKLTDIDITVDYNESNHINYQHSVKLQVEQILNLLDQPTIEGRLKDLVYECRRWDQEFGYNAIDLYPELTEIFVQHGY